MKLLPVIDNDKKISREILLEKICVSEPYFSLQNLTVNNENFVKASFVMENIDFPESFSLSSGESGRHLAILGSCALALTNPNSEKHYYLAIQAEGGNSNVENIAHRDLNRKNREFIVYARTISLNLREKSGQAEAALFNIEGLEISKLIITYKVFSVNLFKRLFSRYHIPDAKNMSNNPYNRTLPLRDIELSDNILTAKTGIIRPEECAGHFDEYPALPVAMLCSLMFELAGRHYCKKSQNENVKYCVDRINLIANRLVSAGEFILLKSTEHIQVEDNKRFMVTACDYSGSIVGQVDVQLFIEQD